MPFKGYSLSRPSLVSSCVAAKTLKGEEINNSKEAARSAADIFHTLTKLKNAKGLFVLGIPVVTQAQIIKTVTRMQLTFLHMAPRILCYMLGMDPVVKEDLCLDRSKQGKAAAS